MPKHKITAGDKGVIFSKGDKLNYGKTITVVSISPNNPIYCLIKADGSKVVYSAFINNLWFPKQTYLNGTESTKKIDHFNKLLRIWD